MAKHTFILTAGNEFADAEPLLVVESNATHVYDAMTEAADHLGITYRDRKGGDKAEVREPTLKLAECVLIGRHGAPPWNDASAQEVFTRSAEVVLERLRGYKRLWLTKMPGAVSVFR